MTQSDTKPAQNQWERVSFRAPPGMIAALERAVEEGKAPSRSEAIRQCIQGSDLTSWDVQKPWVVDDTED